MGNKENMRLNLNLEFIFLKKNIYHLLVALIIALSTSTNAQEWTAEYNSHIDRAFWLFSGRDFEKGGLSYQQAFNLAVSNKDTLRMLEAGNKLGESFYESGQHEKAQEVLTRLDTLIYENNPSGIKAEIKLLLGFTYNFVGDIEAELHSYEQGLALVDSTVDKHLYARLLRNLSNALFEKGQKERSLEMALEALEQFKLLNDTFWIGSINSTLYNQYVALGDYAKGYRHLLVSHQTAKELNSKPLLRVTLYYLSDYHESVFEYSQAISYAKQGLNLSLEFTGDQYTPYYFDRLGDLYLNMEEPEKALVYFNQAFNYYKNIGNDSKAYIKLQRIAMCYIHKKEFEQSRKLLLEALTFFERVGDQYWIGKILIALADIEIRKKNYSSAHRFLEQALQLSEDHDLFSIKYRTQQRFLRLGDSIIPKNEKLAIAKDIYVKSQTRPIESHLRSSIALSRAYSDLESDSSFFYAEKAFELIEKKRSGFMGEALKTNVFSGYAPYYNQVGSWYASQKNDLSSAFKYIEASKARVLLDQLAIKNQGKSLNMNAADRIRLQVIQKTIDKLYKEKEDLVSDTDVLQINQEITDVETEYHAILEETSLKNEKLKNFLYPKTLTLKEVQKLCDSRTAIIEYAFTATKLLIFVITKEDVFYYEEIIERDIVKEHITAFRNSIINRYTTEQLAPLSDVLSSYLLAPIRNRLSDFENLVIIPDGPISLLPFEALSHNGSYLIENHTIKYLPSVSVYDFIQPPHRNSNNSFFGLANSGFIPGTDINGPSIQTSFASLPYTLIEIDSIATNFRESTILKNDDVTEAAFKSLDLSEYKYLHFATHGDINEVAPSQSGLLLSQRKDTEFLFGEDGFLNASEIASLKLSADIVVLSACNTGLGKVINGEGLLGLQRSFLTAGASSVVTSMWSIYDRSTPYFMRSFYSNLIEYEEKELGFFVKFKIWAGWYKPGLVDYKTNALRDAKLTMIEHPYYSHPVHWASFIITGK